MAHDLGVIAAALTPRGKRGDLDFGAAFELIDLLCAARVQGIVWFTAAGEYPAFGIEERTRLVYLAAKRSRVPVYAGVGSVSLDDSIALTREALSARVEGVFMPPPHFYRYSQDEIRDLYLEYLRHVPKSAAVYISNTPSVTTAIEPATALELLATGRFAGIEDPCAGASPFPGHDYYWLSGSDGVAARARIQGAHGMVSAAASAVPELVRALDRSLCGGDAAEAARLDAMLQQFHGWSTRFAEPVILKVAAELRGIKIGPVTVPVGEERRRLLDEFRGWFRDWLPSVKKLSANA